MYRGGPVGVFSDNRAIFAPERGEVLANETRSMLSVHAEYGAHNP